MDRFIYIRNAEDDAYVNKAENFKGMEQSTSAQVILYFESPISSSTTMTGAYDKITLVVTADKEKEAMMAIGGALAGGRSGSTAVIADEYKGVFCDDVITAVTSIETATSAVVSNVEVVTGAKVLTAGESGKKVVMNHAASLVTLPACQAGLYFEVLLLQDTTAGAAVTVTAGDCFFGQIKVTSSAEDQMETQDITHAAAVASPGTHDFVELIHDDDSFGGKAGDILKFTGVDNDAWHVEAFLVTDHANPAAIAVINGSI